MRSWGLQRSKSLAAKLVMAHLRGISLSDPVNHSVLIATGCLPDKPALGLIALLKGGTCIKGYWKLVAATKSLQLCLCDPRDGSPPGSPIPGILQARALEWVAISFSSAWKWKVKVKSLSCGRLFATAWTAAHQAPPSLGFSRQEYWSGMPLPSPES